MVYENVLSDREIRLPQVKVDSPDHKFPILTWSWEEFQAQEERDIAITFVSRQVHNESKVFIHKGATIFQSAQHDIQIPEPCRRDAIKLVYEYTKFDAPMVPLRNKFSSLKEVIIQWKAERYVGYPVVHLHWGTVLETYTPPGYCEFCVLGVTRNLYHQWLNCWPPGVQTKRREMVGNAKVLLMVSLEEVSCSLVCKERVSFLINNQFPRCYMLTLCVGFCHRSSQGDNRLSLAGGEVSLVLNRIMTKTRVECRVRLKILGRSTYFAATKSDSMGPGWFELHIG